MIDENTPYMMIVEDDVIFTQELVTLLPKIEDFVTSRLQGKAAAVLLRSQYQYLHEACRLNDRISLYSTQYALGTPCYIITREAAAHILNIQTPLRWQIDVWKFYYYLGAVELFAPNEDLISVAENMPSVITAMGERFFSNRIRSRRRGRFLSYMLSSPHGYRQLAFYMYCKLRKVFTATHNPESLRRGS